MKTACFKFSLDRGFGFRDFSDSLASHELADNHDTGFELVAVSPKKISGIFYSKRIRRLNLTTLTGEIETFCRESIERVIFEIDLTQGILVIIDPKLERGRFIACLISCTRFRVTLEPFYSEVSQFVSMLSKSDCKFEVLRVIITDVSLSKGIQAKIAASGALSFDALKGDIGNFHGRVTRFDIKLEAEGRKYHEQELRVYPEGRIEIPKAEDKNTALSAYSRLKLNK